MRFSSSGRERKTKTPTSFEAGVYLDLAGGLYPLPYLSAVGLIRLVYRGSDFNAVALSYVSVTLYIIYYLRLYTLPIGWTFVHIILD